MDGSILPVPINEWVNYSDNCAVWYSDAADIMPVLKKETVKQQPAFLYIIGIYDWQYNIKPLLFIKGVKKIVSVRGMLHPGALTQKTLKKKIFLQLLNLYGWQRKYVFQVTDDVEREFVRKQLSIKNEELRIKIAGNFPNLFKQTEMPEKKIGELKLVSVGLISAMKNYLLVLEALRAVSGFSFVSIQYAIYGPVKDSGYWEECKAIIKTLPDKIVVSYHGAIEPSAIETAISAGHVFILPSKSENFGHSILEALSTGRPVITSNNTPWKKLESKKAGINVSIDGTEELVKTIGFFAAMEQTELNEWHKGAVHYATGAVDTEKIKNQYKNLFGI